MATRLVNTHTPTNILFPTTLDASKRAHSACRDGLGLFSSSMYLLVTRCTEPTKLHVAGALHRLFLVHFSLTNQHCTLAATQDTDLVFFFFLLYISQCAGDCNHLIYSWPLLWNVAEDMNCMCLIFFFPLCAHVIRVLCNVVNYVDWDMTMRRTLTKQQVVQLRNTWIFSSLSGHGIIVCKPPETSTLSVCVCCPYLPLHRHGCVSICRKFNSIELILDILDTFAIFLLPLVKKHQLYGCTKWQFMIWCQTFHVYCSFCS